VATTAVKILLIDDQPFFITMLRNVLEQQGYQVITAGAGPEGLDRARKDKPDVILLDIEMPGMNGFQVCEKLKQDPALKGIPVVILTATEDTKLNERAFKAGAEITVSKSVPGDRLINILKLAVAKVKPTTD
jgi:two-component system cell cycle response regulator